MGGCSLVWVEDVWVDGRQGGGEVQGIDSALGLAGWLVV